MPPISWDVPSGQPYCLSALHSLSRLISDKDVALFPALSEGVPTGYHHDIPASNVFPPRPDDVPPDTELQICDRKSDQGLLGVQADGRHFFYQVCPFGATFSALWFARSLCVLEVVFVSSHSAATLWSKQQRVLAQ